MVPGFSCKKGYWRPLRDKGEDRAASGEDNYDSGPAAAAGAGPAGPGAEAGFKVDHKVIYIHVQGQLSLFASLQ
jgi:hypothetical protein